ncbi:unnamed protein product [Soboliphyme baturini]|uniref:Uncharacterized protein n=1 Tax=Soboliphyme baturini TaxID=241478 RepID=A0A183J630_9BILA|nr:unnamed protein product [Soboliphyme baturini]
MISMYGRAFGFARHNNRRQGKDTWLKHISAKRTHQECVEDEDKVRLLTVEVVKVRELVIQLGQDRKHHVIVHRGPPQLVDDKDDDWADSVIRGQWSAVSGQPPDRTGRTEGRKLLVADKRREVSATSAAMAWTMTISSSAVRRTKTSHRRGGCGCGGGSLGRRRKLAATRQLRWKQRRAAMSLFLTSPLAVRSLESANYLGFSLTQNVQRRSQAPSHQAECANAARAEARRREAKQASQGATWRGGVSRRDATRRGTTQRCEQAIPLSFTFPYITRIALDELCRKQKINKTQHPTTNDF